MHIARALPLVPAILMLAAASALGDTRRTGTIEGLVTVGPELVSKRVRFNLYEDPRRNAPPQQAPSAEAEIPNIVVYLEDEDGVIGDRGHEPGHHVMRQERSSFVPHVLPVAVGDTVEFPNTDPVFHNVFSLSRAAAFDLGRYPRGDSRSVRFDEPGIVKVFCHIHSDMSGVVMVLPHPFFAVPDADGRYRIEGVPAGRYTVVGWHERARRVSGSVVVEAGRTTSTDLAIPISDEHER